MSSSPEFLLGGLALFSLAYNLVALALIDHFFSKPSEAEEFSFSPPVSLIIPVKGKDDGMDGNFLALCQQEYPCYQVIFALSDADDPAVPVINQVIRECPDQDICMVISDRKIGANEKVNNFENGYLRAKYNYLVCIDSDIRVGRDYLKKIMPPLSNGRIGLVTCIPVYRDSQNLSSAFETIGVNSNILPMWIPMLYLLGGAKYGSGATLAIRRDVFEEVGGFKRVANLVADDAAIGQHVNEKGYRIYLSPYIVYTIHQQDTWTDYFFHALRWNRTIRAVATGPYICFALFFGTFYAFLFWIINIENGLGFLFFLAISFMRIVITSYYNENYFKDPSTMSYLWLVPVRDIIMPLEWLLGFTGNTIHWRGQRYRILKGARIEKIV